VKLLADENVHGDIVAWPRAGAHDVLYAAELLRGNSDDELLAIAREQERILITDDKDFGELVYHRQLVTHGIVLLRLKNPSVAARLRHLETIWATVESQLPGRFVVTSDWKVRARDLLRT
jgi:predicted nuclease of predicted toxin-antitoxin system